MSPRAPGTGSDRVLALLQSNPGHTIPARKLMAAAHIATLEALRTHISRARRALGDQGNRLHAVRGAGYRWDRPQTVPPPAGLLTLDLNARTVSLDGDTVTLTTHQLAVLQQLTEADVDQPLSAEQLQQRTGSSSIAAVKIHISDLRKALRPLPIEIVTVRGRGYLYRGTPAARCLRATPPQPSSLHVSSDGQVLRDGRPLRLRQREHALLELLVEQTGQPVSYTQLLAYANIPDLDALQTAISCVRTALRDSPLHCGHKSDAYTLRIGTTTAASLPPLT